MSVGLLRMVRAEASHHQKRAAIGRNQIASICRAGHSESFLQQRGHSVKAFASFKRLATRAFVEDYPEGGLVFDAHRLDRWHSLLVSGNRFFAALEIWLQVRIEQSACDFISALHSHVEYFRTICRERRFGSRE